jgi:hypothetical protein
MFALGLQCTEPIAAADRESVGWVFDSVGDWLQDGQKIPRKSGDPVYAGAVIALAPAYRAANPGSGAIIIKLFSGSRQERSVDKPATFDQPIEVPKSLGEQTSRIGRLIRAIGGLFGEHPDKYLITAVRGADLLRLREAVVKMDGNSADLAPIFTMTPPAKYLARFRLVEAEPDESSKALEPAAIDWAPGRAVPVAMPGLRPGLWRVSLLHPEDQRPLGVDAWVLICAPNRYEAAAESFREAIEVTGTWDATVNAAEVRSFLRTALDALSRQSPASPPPKK